MNGTCIFFHVFVGASSHLFVFVFIIILIPSTSLPLACSFFSPRLFAAATQFFKIVHHSPNKGSLLRHLHGTYTVQPYSFAFSGKNFDTFPQLCHSYFSQIPQKPTYSVRLY